MRPSADPAGRAVALSIDVPSAFDAPLAPHHKLIGRWAAGRDTSARRYTQRDARQRIERMFDAAVLDILGSFELANLRVVVLNGDADLPPALAVVCDSVGQIDLGWIEKSNVLRETLNGPVAPVRWQAAAYKALAETMYCTLPVFSYEDLFEEISGCYWDGATDDASAIRAQIEWHGVDPDDIDEEMLPSAMKARRPDWMLAEKAGPLKHLPVGLRQRLRRLREAHKAVKNLPAEGSAWHFDFDVIVAYLPEFEDRGHLPPMTLVPADHFARELDDAGQRGMDHGFMDIAGLCPLPDADKVDAWFASLKLGAEYLAAAQDLIQLDPAKLY